VALSAQTIDETPAREHPAPIPEPSQRSRGLIDYAGRPGFLGDCWLFLRVLLFAAVVPYVLRLKISRVAGVLEPGSDPSEVSDRRVKKISDFVERAILDGKPFVRSGCLTRGLTRYYFLRRAGLDVTLCFGMGGSERDFMGHCWLEKDGRPFLEGEDTQRYVEMYRVSRAGGRASIAGCAVTAGRASKT